MKDRRLAFLEAECICRAYAVSLRNEKPEWADVASQCADMIDDASMQALTIAEIGDGSCQELSSFLIKPEIDYTSGLPRK